MAVEPSQSDVARQPVGPPAVVLLSGGLDSATCLALATAEGFRCHALSFDYGQRHTFELAAAAHLAAQFGASHRTVRLDLGNLGGSALTDAALEVPKHTDAERAGEEEAGEEIPVTYVPARNLTFLSIALGVAEVIGARDLFIGVNALDYSGYPDCRPAFLRAFEQVAAVATKAGVEAAGDEGSAKGFAVHAPLLRLTKGQIVRLGARLGVDFAATHTCYDPGENGAPCGTCDACRLRAKGFAEAGLPDPLLGA